MATLALGVAGAALGSAFGPLGASIGWTLGSALGNALFPQKVEGPRLQDLRIQTSSYGKMVPLLWGTMRVAGNVIWIGNGGELVEHEETSGGKGGPEVTNYTYSASFAVALVDVEIAGIRRIWWNGRLVSDNGGSDLPVTIYRGTEDQLPDPTMEADLGVGNVPAYRGVSYIVFEDMFLTDGGNSIGNWEFEVFTSVGEIPIRVSTFDAQVINGSGTVQGVTYDADTGTISQFAYGYGGGAGTGYRVTQFDIDGNALASPVDGSVSGALNLRAIVTNLPVAIYSIGDLGDGISNDFAWYVNGSQGHVLIEGSVVPLSGSQGIYLYDRIYFAMAGGIGAYAAPDGQPQPALIASLALPGLSSVDNLSIAWSDNGKVYAFDQVNVVLWECDANLTEVLRTWDEFPDDGGTYLTDAPIVYNNILFMGYAAGFQQRMNVLYLGDELSNYPQERVDDFPSFGWLGGNMANLFGGYFLGYDGVVLLDAPLEAVPLSEIVADISDRSGLDELEYDVTELTDLVDGYLVDRQTSGRDMIQPLRDAYFFDGVEIDDKVVYPKRKADSLVTIPADDLAAHVDGEEAPPVVGIMRAQEVDLPAIVTVNYVNATADYQAGAQTSQRQVTQSQSAVSLSLQINMSDQKAKSVADTHVLLPWVERNRFTSYVSRKYAKYTPTDVVTVDGKKMRIIDVSETRAGVLKFDGVAALAPVLIQAGLPVTNPTFTSVPNTPNPPASSIETLMYLFDLPLVDDADEPNGIYAAVSGPTGWSGANVFKSSDGGTTYTSVASSATAHTMGTTTDVLGNWLGGNMFDEGNVVTVRLRPGQTLASATELAVLNGANECVIGDEVLQFKNAELVDTDTYELSGLLRGRLGTEWAMGTHAAGDRFALLPLLRVPAPSDELTQARLYKPVTFGATVAGAIQQSFTNAGRALKPYSPVLLGGGGDGSGDVALHWTRRTRIGGAWLPNVDVPLSEAAESYVLQIWNSDYSLCARAEFPSTTSYTYTEAEQIADFGAAQETIFFTVGQIGEWSLGKQTRGIAPGSGSTSDDPIAPIAPLE